MTTSVDPVALANSVCSGDRRALAKSITLAESTRPDHRKAIAELLKRLAATPRRSMRVGISGAPGVGKSTMIDALGCLVVSEGHRLAVLTIDPSSTRSGGSILADKTRMPRLSQCPDAYIRPSPTSGALGGVGRHTRESIQICEAAGFDVVLVETVGVGQSETAVANMTDVFLLLLLPGGGDELQGIKRGIMELADVVLVNKADGELEEVAKRTAADFANAVRLLQPRIANWVVPVEAGSALNGTGLVEIWSHLLKCVELLQSSGEFERRRAEQSLGWMWEDTSEALRTALRSQRSLRPMVESLESRVRTGELPATVAAERLVAAFFSERTST